MHFGGKDRLRVIALEYIRRCREQGATADEICAALNLGHNSIAPRLTELKQAGLIVELYHCAGKRLRRQTRAGCAAGVVIASEFADPKRPPVARPLFGDLGPDRSYAEWVSW
jgi:hypothetical protein